MPRLPDALRAHLLAPHRPGEPPRVDRRGEARNSVCRDHVVLYLQVDEARISAAGHRATGCPVAMACASAAARWLEGRALAEARPEALGAALAADFGAPNAASRHAHALVERALAEALGG